MGNAGLRHGTIKSYLSAVRYLQISYGLPNPFDQPMPRLDLVMRGIKSAQGKQGLTPRQKLPITPVILRQLRGLWCGPSQGFREALLWAASVTCFFGFMRAGEITLKSKESFDPTYHLSLEDLAADSLSDPSFIQLTLKGSKTDPFRRGVAITVGKTGDALCPVKALCSYLSLRGEREGPLFIHEDGSPLTRSYFVEGIREALKRLGHHDVNQYAGHSFRAGAATTAAALGVEDSIIKLLGRFGDAP